MPPIVIRHDNCEATILPEVGFNCVAFRVWIDGEAIDVIDSAPEFLEGEGRPSGNGIPILFPFPNRIEHGKFSWEGKDYQLPLTPGHPHALHGFVLNRPWRVTRQGENAVIGEWQLSVDAPELAPHWPTDCRIEVRYAIKEQVLRCDIRIVNPDDQPMPWGFGTHAYFKLPLGASGSVEHCLIQAPAHKQWELNECIPTGTISDVPPEKDIRTGAYVSRTPMDDVLTDLRPTGNMLECVILDEQAGIEVIQACDPEFRELVVYTPPGRDAVCMEPYTCVTNAINLQQQGIDAGWQTLEPGGMYETWIEMTARRLIV